MLLSCVHLLCTSTYIFLNLCGHRFCPFVLRTHMSSSLSYFVVQVFCICPMYILFVVRGSLSVLFTSTVIDLDSWFFLLVLCTYLQYQGCRMFFCIRSTITTTRQCSPTASVISLPGASILLYTMSSLLVVVDVIFD